MKGFGAELLPKECNSLLAAGEVTGAFLTIMIHVQAPSAPKSNPYELPGNSDLAEAIPMVNMPLCRQMILGNPCHLRLTAC